MKELLRHFVNLSAQEYDIFLHLSWKHRLQGTIGLAFIYSVMIVLVFLAFYPSVQDDAAAAPVLWAFLVLLAVGFVPSLAPLLLPRLLEHRTLLTAGIGVFGGLVGFGAVFVVDFYGLSEPDADPAMLLGLSAGILLLMLGLHFYGRVMKTVAEERSGLEAEMRLANSIQRQLLPTTDLATRHYRLHASAQLAKDVGGDFFDVVPVDDARVYVAIGDVSGHDVGAGLMMATTKGAFRVSAEAGMSPETVVTALNRTVYEHGGRRMFVSFQCALFDFARSVLLLVNAGHMPVLHFCRATDEVQEVHVPAPALGLMREATFRSAEIPIASGDALLFYTDGLTEVFDREQREFGVAGVTAAVTEAGYEDGPATVAATLRDAAAAFSDGIHPRDDLTTVIVQVC